jgi:anaerobic dimethyl sulfoxide reductase subunit B (iron-sulfur subunit)
LRTGSQELPTIVNEEAIYVMAKQYGFYFDVDRCVLCRACEVACKAVHNIEPGIKWMRVVDIWGGVYPNVTRAFLALACMHCRKPACVEACPTGAISKRVEDGIVVVDRDKCNGCSGCRDCLSACPYGVPQFDDNGIMQMCDFCTGINIEPACAVSCPTEALKFGTLDELLEMGKRKAAKRMGGSTEPSVVIAATQ